MLLNPFDLSLYPEDLIYNDDCFCFAMFDNDDYDDYYDDELEEEDYEY